MIQWAYADALIPVIPFCTTTTTFPLEVTLSVHMRTGKHLKLGNSIQFNQVGKHF